MHCDERDCCSFFFFEESTHFDKILKKKNKNKNKLKFNLKFIETNNEEKI